MNKKTAVILFNLGGPDSLEAVKPFLFNLFNDKAIIGAPGPIRWLLAKYISGKRAPIARNIYAKIGGRSPLVPQTEAQARGVRANLRAVQLLTRELLAGREPTAQIFYLAGLGELALIAKPKVDVVELLTARLRGEAA